MEAQAELLRTQRRDTCGLVPYRNNSIEGPARAEFGNRLLQFRTIGVKPQRRRTVSPRVVEHVAPVGGQDEIEAQPLRRAIKLAHLITGLRRDQENPASHTGSGSAQQYQGSSMYAASVVVSGI